LFGADDYAALAELARLLLLRQLGTHCFILDHAQAAAVLCEDGASFERLLADTAYPRWLLYVSLTAADYLPDERMAWQQRDADALAKQAGATDLTNDFGGSAQSLASRLRRSPATPYQNTPRGGYREVFCLTQLDKVPVLLERIEPLLRAAAAASHLVHGVYVQPTVQGASCHLCVTLFHHGANKAAAAATESRLVSALADAGGFFSRPYGAWAKVAYARDSAIVPHLRKVKQLFDPKGVLNPGRLCF
jgi:FAD/FMN-containing dehydrogenase